jgi:hypothetical protein
MRQKIARMIAIDQEINGNLGESPKIEEKAAGKG